MFTRVFFSLIFLLELTAIISAQFGQCDFREVIKAGRTYYVFSPANYPYDNYKPGTACRWTAISDRPISMECNLILQSNSCSFDLVIVKTSKTSIQHYCSTRSFTTISSNKRTVIELYTSQQSHGGKFFCSLQTVNVTSDENCTCGRKKPTRIVGGNDTDVNEYPMMAGLVDAEKKIIFCGATIINPKQVLTAAHCVYRRDFTIIGVIVGEHDITTGSDTDATQFFRVSGYIIHPNYNEKDQDNDAAIVNVDGKIKFNELVGPVCLPFQHSKNSFSNKRVEILGWGNIEFGERQSNTLQKAEVYILNNERCSQIYNRITRRKICTIAEGKDSCQFDSGGPVLWMNPTTKNLVLIGIISYGRTCADNLPAVNSRVSASIDWILSLTPKGFKYCKVE